MVRNYKISRTYQSYIFFSILEKLLRVISVFNLGDEGLRHAVALKSLVPCEDSFKETLKAIKIWAEGVSL